MTALSHLDPDFGSVVAIEAVNEPIMDATQTPGYGDCTFRSEIFLVFYYFIFTFLMMSSPEELC